MTRERNLDPEATMELPSLNPAADEDGQDFDPEQTLVREDWESTVIRRVAPHLAAVQSAIADSEGEERFGWESEGLRRLSRQVQQLRSGRNS